MVQRRRFIGVGAAMMATGALVGLPAFSSGATTSPDLRSFDAAPRAASPRSNPKIEPPLHGTNPHGQGSVAVVDIGPNAQRPSRRSDRRATTARTSSSAAPAASSAPTAPTTVTSPWPPCSATRSSAARTRTPGSPSTSPSPGPARRALHEHRHLPGRGPVDSDTTSPARSTASASPAPRWAGSPACRR